ncbi:class I SAM-dependent methyltransferase [Candidatus Soleaferrea massiliensis]|uniref:class I SAM-dependent methyltransferase n=1 Tax=Candidatus Soleaferrea massiliensis TaxID=1470354 RepID=UPI00058DF69A|nr:class I SAM-dependent methyltransferase [Candidatus Soleaferrea massiliensis]
MQQNSSITALVSAFARAYHSIHHTVKIYDDPLARDILGESYERIAQNMTDGIPYFCPGFEGTKEDALRWIVDSQLSPSPLGRAAYAGQCLQNAVSIGAEQYLIFAAGYDTTAYRQPDFMESLRIVEIDHPATQRDKLRRARACLEIPRNLRYAAVDFADGDWPEQLRKQRAFEPDAVSFCSLQGISYYLSPEQFDAMIAGIAGLVGFGSSLVLDYPDRASGTDAAGERAKKQQALAGEAGEQMLAGYSYREMEALLAKHGFYIYEHLTPAEITERFFELHNQADPAHPMTAQDNTNYCLAVKRNT